MENFSILQNVKVLLIDDDEIIRDALSIAFQNKGCSLKACEDAEKGLQVLEKSRFDIAICDYRLPGMDGFDFFKMAETRQPHMLNILISAYDYREKVRKFSGIRIHAFILKPFSVKELINVMIYLVDQQLEKTAGSCARKQARATKYTI